MTELIAAVATGLLWLTAGGLTVLCAGRALRLGTGAAVLAGYPLFWAAQVLVAQLLGLLGLLTTGVLLAVYGFGTLLLAALALRPGRPRAAPSDDDTPEGAPAIGRVVRSTAVFVFGVLALFTLLAPVHIWDVLAYHLPMIASYIQNGSLDAWPTQDLRQIYRVNAGELQMLHVALLARSDAWVELPNVAALGVLLVGTFQITRLATPRSALAWLAVLLVLTAPQIVIGAGTAKNDLVFTAVLIGSFYWITRAIIEPDRRVLFVLLAGLCGALAGATKVMGLNVVGAVGLLSLVLVFRRRMALRHVILYGCAVLAGLLLLAGTVYVGNLTRTAVPVGVAPGEVNFTIGLRNLAAAAEFYIYDLMLKRLVTLPAIEHDFLHYGYLFPAMAVLAVGTAVAQLRRRRIVPAALAMLTATLFASVIAVRLPIHWDQRFMMWLVPVASVLALLHIQDLSARRLLQVTWIGALLAVVNAGVLLTLESDRLLPRSARHLLTTGTPARIVDVPNRRYPEMIGGFATLDRVAEAQDSILYIGTDDSWMYAAWGSRFTRYVEGVWDGGHAERQVAAGAFRFLVIEDAAPPAVRAAAERRARTSWDLVETARGRTIYQRSPRPEARSGDAAPRPFALDGRTPAGVRGYTSVMSPIGSHAVTREAPTPW